ncbi:MAG: hypothetical protein AABW85_02385 [archaeon]
MGKLFLATLGVGKGTWGHVSRIISEQEFDKIFLISTEWVKENFNPQKEVEWILINNRAGFDVIKDEIKSKIPQGELVVSIISGSGKEHTALLGALKEAKRDYSLIILTGGGTKFY